MNSYTSTAATVSAIWFGIEYASVHFVKIVGYYIMLYLFLFLLHRLSNVESSLLCVSAEGDSCSNCPGLELTSSLEMGKLLILLAWFDWQIYFHDSFISALTISCIGSLSCLWSFPQFSSLFLLVYMLLACRWFGNFFTPRQCEMLLPPCVHSQLHIGMKGV